jgi:hypothetical protein
MSAKQLEVAKVVTANKTEAPLAAAEKGVRNSLKA